jgi:hypothetical protein
MSWSYASLGGLLGNKEEVEALVVILVFNKLAINDTTRLRIRRLAISVLDEHSLVDSFVDNYKSDGRLRELVVKWLDSFFELSDLLSNDLVSHLLSNSVSVDDDLRREGSLVFVGKGFDSTNQASVKILFDNLLVFLLDDDVGEVRGAGSVG